MGGDIDGWTRGGVGTLIADEIAKHAIQDTLNDSIYRLEMQWIQLECKPRVMSRGIY